MSPLDRRRRSVAPKIIGMVAASVAIALIAGGLLYVGRASAPYNREVNRGYASMAASIVAASNATGTTFGTLFAGLPGMDRTPLSSTLEGLVRSTATEEKDAATLAPPTPTGGLGARFLGVMATRATAMISLEKTLDGLLGMVPAPPAWAGASKGALPAPPASITPAAAVTSITRVGQRLAQADRDYAAVRKAFSKAAGRARLPASQWITGSETWSSASIGALVGYIEGSPSLAAFHRTVLLPQTLQLFPEPVPSPTTAAAGTTTLEVIPTTSVVVTVVLANQGNIIDRAPEVTANLVAVGSEGPPVTKKWSTPILYPGTSQAIAFAAFPVHPGRTYQVTVSVQPPPGQSDLTDTTLTFTIKVATAAPPPTTTTTTVPPPRRHGKHPTSTGRSTGP